MVAVVQRDAFLVHSSTSPLTLVSAAAGRWRKAQADRATPGAFAAIAVLVSIGDGGDAIATCGVAIALLLDRLLLLVNRLGFLHRLPGRRIDRRDFGEVLRFRNLSVDSPAQTVVQLRQLRLDFAGVGAIDLHFHTGTERL